MAGDTLSVRIHVHRTRQRRGGEDFTVEVDLLVQPGITILFGPSGSGKSTVLQAIAGLTRPTSGRVALGQEVWFDSRPGAAGVDLPVHKRHVAYVFQSLALFPHLTGLANVAYGIDRHASRAERRARAMELLARLGVGHLAHRRPRTFSGGEAQRVALARALAMSPRLVLLDEPFSALDRDLRIQLCRLVRELVDELGLPLIQVTHNHGEARALADRVVRMADGRIIAQGSADQIIGPPGAVAGGDGSGDDSGHESGHGHRRRSNIDTTPMPTLR